MAYNNSMKKIQVFRPVNEQDKTVRRALEIQKYFKVLPYPEVEKRLDTKIDYSILNDKYKKGNV